MTDERVDREAEQRRFRSTLVKVLTVQVIALLVLWLLQSRYGGS